MHTLSNITSMGDPVPVARPGGLLLAGKRIFVIEDDSFNLGIISSILQQHGAEVSFDAWGVGTVRRLQLFQPVDAILFDLHLPNGVSGYDVYEEIKQVPALSTAKMVIVSASDPDREMKLARSKGFAGYIGKPIRFNVFPKQIATILNGEQLWQAA